MEKAKRLWERRGPAILVKERRCDSGALYRRVRYPPLSIIVPVYNKEKQVSRFIESLFESAAQYPNFCEILVVDNGSSDYTYEIAWATTQKCRKRWPNIKGRVVRCSASIGRTEVYRMGVDRAFGELIIAINGEILLKPNAIKEIVREYYSGEYRLEAEKFIKVFQNPWFLGSSHAL